MDWLQTREELTVEQINEACYVDMNANKEVFESLSKNVKVKYDGTYFSYKVSLMEWDLSLVSALESLSCLQVQNLPSQLSLSCCKFRDYLDFSKVVYYSCVQSKYEIKNKDQLLNTIQSFLDGISIIDLKDSYLDVMQDLQVNILSHLSAPAFSSLHAE